MSTVVIEYFDEGERTMDLHKRLQHMPKQKRAFIEGSIELIGDEWVFFDDFEDIAHDIRALGPAFEIFKKNRWHKAFVLENGNIKYNNKVTTFSDGDRARFPRKLAPMYEELLLELEQHSFDRFIHTLNQQGYSIYDCIYCHNFHSFLQHQEKKIGVNTLIFDNNEMICTVIHHFIRTIDMANDRFEFTKSNGERFLLSKLTK